MVKCKCKRAKCPRRQNMRVRYGKPTHQVCGIKKGWLGVMTKPGNKSMQVRVVWHAQSGLGKLSSNRRHFKCVGGT